MCLNFADRCLSFLKDNVDEGPRYSFKHLDPFDHITLEQIGSQTGGGGSGGGGAAANTLPGSAMGVGGGVGYNVN